MIKYSLLPINLPSGGYRAQPVLDTVTLETVLGNTPDSVVKIANFTEVFNAMIDYVKLGYRVISPVLTVDVTMSGSISQLTENFSPDDVNLNIKPRQNSVLRLTSGLTLTKVTSQTSALTINYAAGLQTNFTVEQPFTIGMAAYDQPIQAVGTLMRETPYSKISIDTLDENGETFESYLMTSGFVQSTTGKVIIKMGGEAALTAFKALMPYAPNCILRLNRQTTGQLENATTPFMPVWLNREIREVEPSQSPVSGSPPTGNTIICAVVSMTDLEGTPSYDISNLPESRITFNYNPTTGHIEGGVHILSSILSIGVIGINIADCIDNNSGFMIIPVTLDAAGFTAPNEGDVFMKLAVIRSQLTSFTSHAYFQMEIMSP